MQILSQFAICAVGICRYTNQRSPKRAELRFQATLQQIPGSVGLSRPTWLGTLGVGKGREQCLVMMAWSDPKLEAKHVVTSDCPNHCIQSDDQSNIFQRKSYRWGKTVFFPSSLVKYLAIWWSSAQGIAASLVKYGFLKLQDVTAERVR